MSSFSDWKRKYFDARDPFYIKDEVFAIDSNKYKSYLNKIEEANLMSFIRKDLGSTFYGDVGKTTYTVSPTSDVVSYNGDINNPTEIRCGTNTVKFQTYTSGSGFDFTDDDGLIDYSRLTFEVKTQEEDMNNNSLNSLLGKLDLSLGKLISDFPHVVLCGSRAAGCAKPDSDWDLVVFFDGSRTNAGYEFISKDKIKVMHKFSSNRYGYGIRKRIDGLDLMFEDMNCDMWHSRELCTHLTGYGQWLSGGQWWKTNDIDWADAARLKQKQITEMTLLNKYAFGKENEKADLKRLWCLQNKIYIPPTRMLNGIVEAEKIKGVYEEIPF